MDARIRKALATGRTIDITTMGRETATPRRIEIWFHNLDGDIFITGSPGKRGWYANMLANPDFTFHLKQGVVADLPARATPVTDPTERRSTFTRILRTLNESAQLDAWLAGSPLVRVTFVDNVAERTSR